MAWATAPTPTTGTTGRAPSAAACWAGCSATRRSRTGRSSTRSASPIPTPQNRHYAQGLGVDGVTPNIASHADGDDANADSASNIPEGARIRLKAGVDVDARCAAAPHPAACRAIGDALRDYGAYLVDRGGHPAIYAEDLTGKDVSWNGVLEARDTSGFPPGDFEVLSLPSPLQAR